MGGVSVAVAQAMRYAGCPNRRSLGVSDVFPRAPSARWQMALAMVAQALDRQNKVVTLAAASVDEELRTIAAGVVAMANTR